MSGISGTGNDLLLEVFQMERKMRNKVSFRSLSTVFAEIFLVLECLWALTGDHAFSPVFACIFVVFKKQATLLAILNCAKLWCLLLQCTSHFKNSKSYHCLFLFVSHLHAQKLWVHVLFKRILLLTKCGIFYHCDCLVLGGVFIFLIFEKKLHIEQSIWSTLNSETSISSNTPALDVPALLTNISHGPSTSQAWKKMTQQMKSGYKTQ